MKNRMGSSRLRASSIVALSLTALGSSFLGASCTLEEVDSDAIRTRGMHVEMLAIAPGNDSTLVRVNLTVGGASGTRVELTGADVLVVEASGTAQELGRAGRGRYEHTLQGESSEEIVVRLERGEEDATAQGVAALPAPFAMMQETFGAGGIDRASDVVFSWQNPSDDPEAIMNWSVEGDCIWPESGITPDDGVMTLRAASVRVRPSQRGSECAVRLTLDRVSAGVVDGVFVPGSSFRAIQRRAISFVSVPSSEELGMPAEAAPEEDLEEAE